MTLTQEQIENLSKNLSKITVDSEKLTGKVNGVLEYISLLNEVDTTGVEPTVSVVENEKHLRKDTLEEKKEISREKLLSCSKQKVVADQIAITNIMK